MSVKSWIKAELESQELGEWLEPLWYASQLAQATQEE